jgi:hypothetical protein
MVAQPFRAFLEPAQAAAGDHVDVGGAVQIPLLEGVQAVARPLHRRGVLAQSRWQLLRGREVGSPGLLVEEQHPPGPQPQQLRHPREGSAQRIVQVEGSVEGGGDIVQDLQVAGATAELLAALSRVGDGGAGYHVRGVVKGNGGAPFSATKEMTSVTCTVGQATNRPGFVPRLR